MKYDGQLLYTELWIIEENVMGKETVIPWEIFAKHKLNMEFIASLMCRSMNISWIIYW